MEYKYKRYFCKTLEEQLKDTQIIFLLGPRKCGKTVALKQIDKDNEKSNYTDIKMLDSNEKAEYIDAIINSIKNDEDVIYLLDEVTYLDKPELDIERIANAYADISNNNTRIVFAGSQSIALNSWGNRSFSGNALFLKADFINYAEWLEYKNETNINADTYYDFLTNTRQFYKFTNTRAYLNGCLEETVLSNYKTTNILLNNDCSLINEDMLLDIMYLAMFSKHNHVNYNTFINSKNLSNDINYYFRKETSKIGTLEIDNRIADIFINRFNSLKGISLDSLKQAIAFLYKNDLVNVTYNNDKLESKDIYYELISPNSSITTKEQLFSSINITIKYPMFYMDILKDVLKKEMPERINNSLLGSLVECNIRGLLTDKNVIEYHDYEDREIDYINISSQVAIEISISNKRMRNTNFDILPDEYTKILITKDDKGEVNNIEKIPYCDFVYELSKGKQLLDYKKTPVKVNEYSNEQETICDKSHTIIK